MTKTRLSLMLKVFLSRTDCLIRNSRKLCVLM